MWKEFACRVVITGTATMQPPGLRFFPRFPPFPTFSTLGKPVGSAVFFAVAVNTQPPTRSFALFSRDNVRSRQRQPRTRQDRTISFRFIKIPSVPWPELAPAVRHRSPVDVSSMHARSRGSTVAFHESRDRC